MGHRISSQPAPGSMGLAMTMASESFDASLLPHGSLATARKFCTCKKRFYLSSQAVTGLATVYN
jgi:hypothetical protein